MRERGIVWCDSQVLDDVRFDSTEQACHDRSRDEG